jgi:hypothetical protein
MPRYSPKCPRRQKRRRLFDDRLHAFQAATFPCIQAASAGKSSTGLRATATTPAPTESKHRTIALPIPRDPPVTSARLPFNSFGSFLKEIICNLRY